MNYISHYFLDSRMDSPYFNVGLAVPDFMGNAQRKWKPLLKAGSLPRGEQGSRLWQGITAHVEADALFHNSDFFREETQLIRQRLVQQGLEGQGVRLFFVAHICLELMLDRLILKSYPGMADRFYSDLAAVEKTLLLQELQNAVNPDYGNFPLMFDRFLQGRYLYTYLEEEKMLYALNRIIGRTGQPAFDESYTPRFLYAMLETEEALARRFMPFFGWMEERLHAQRASNLPYKA